MRGTELNDTVAAVWDSLRVESAERLQDLETALLAVLRELEAAPDDAQAIQNVIDVLRQYQVWTPVELALEQRAVVKGDRATTPAVTRTRHVAMEVLFATDREPELWQKEPGRIFGTGRGELAYGSAHVSIPDDHRMGKMEKPRWWRLEFRPNPEKHVVVLNAEELPEKEFQDRCQALTGEGKAEALVFVHGYRTSFKDALQRTAQLAYDLKFPGVPILFSWPSEAATIPYTVDETNALASRAHFRTALKLIAGQLGFRGIHLISHSMGGRLVAESLSQEPFARAALRQLVFAAPDVDSATFKDLVLEFQGCAERTTLYASNNDKAMHLSRTVHKYPRAGEAGLGLVVTDSIDTVDVSALDTSFDGHAYFADNRSVVSDLLHLIRNGLAPDQRGLRRDDWHGLRYWRFEP